jgi:hypothetical protein
MPPTAAVRAAHAGGAAWISSPAAIPAASRCYRWSRIMSPGPQVRALRTRSGACGSLLAPLTGVRYAKCHPFRVIPA